MDEQRAPRAESTASNHALYRVLGGSAVLSFIALFSIAYFYGSVQTAGDILITPKSFYQVELRALDPETEKICTYYVENIELTDNVDPQAPKTKAILEPAYIKIFDTLKDDHLAVLKKHATNKTPRLSLMLQLGPDRLDKTKPHKPLILQQVDFFADDEPYRISGRLDKKQSEESFYFVHKGVCKDLDFLLQLIQ